MADDDGVLANVEVISDSAGGVADGPAEAWSLSTVLRTLAAVVTAGAVCWGAAALQGSRVADEKTACVAELQMAMFTMNLDGAQGPQDERVLLAEAADECGLDYVSSSLGEPSD